MLRGLFSKFKSILFGDLKKKNYIILNFKKSNQILTKLIELRVNILGKSYLIKSTFTYLI